MEQDEQIIVPTREEPPRRLSIEPSSPHYFPDIRNVGVRFNTVPRKGDVIEYDADAGWIRVHLRDSRGNAKRERGKFVSMTLRGNVEPFWKD